MQVRRRLYEILQVAAPGDYTSKVVDLSILTLIVLNVIALIVESTFQGDPPAFFWTFEVVSVAIFTVELALRVWVAPENPSYRGPVAGRLRFLRTPMSLVDLLAILPFYVTLFLQSTSADLRVFRAFRLFRILRLAKLGRYSRAVRTFGRVFYERRGELVAMLCFLSVLLLVASTVMYFVEHDAQPDEFGSIPQSVWWGVITLTTVGYGDVSPMTTLGKVLGALIAVLGIGMFALPAGILGGAFAESLEQDRQAAKQAAENPPAEHRCPHCGEDISGRKS